MINIAVFASGTGSNAVNLVRSFNSGDKIHVAICLTDRENAPVMERMAELGVPAEFYPRSVWKENPQVILEALRSHDIKIIVLAGFLCYVHPDIVRAYEGRILNIHPSLLPAYGGKGMHGANVHKAVIEAGELKSGATVHVVTEEMDNGPIVMQKEVAVLPDDTPESLEAKVHEVEYEIFPKAVVKLAEGFEPPAIPKSIDDEWAEKLGVPNNAQCTTPNPQSQMNAQYKTQNTQPPYIGQMHTGVSAKPWMQGNAGRSMGSMQAAANGEPMPPTWLVWSVVCTILCCFIPGIVAIIQSARVSSKYYAGDVEGAKRASRNAEIWIIISFVLGVISNTLYLPLTIAGLL